MPIDNLNALLQQRTYPGMLTSETELTRKWLQKYGRDFDRIDFDVPVGNGGEFLPEWSDARKADWKLLTQKKIDFMVWIHNQPVIVEVKKRLSIKDLGQLGAYAYLWHRDHPESPRPELRAIAYDGDQDAIDTLTVHGIHVELFEE